jgi:hypothetical protein
MNTTTVEAGGLLGSIWSVSDIEEAVESVLFKQLLRERMRQTSNEVERELHATALDGFEDWADEYGLPATPHVLAAYMVELHSDGVEIDDLKLISEAYLNQHDRDVHVPIRAALKYCSR